MTIRIRRRSVLARRRHDCLAGFDLQTGSQRCSTDCRASSVPAHRRQIIDREARDGSPDAVSRADRRADWSAFQSDGDGRRRVSWPAADTVRMGDARAGGGPFVRFHSAELGCRLIGSSAFTPQALPALFPLYAVATMAGTLLGATLGIRYLPASSILLVLGVVLTISGVRLVLW